MDFRKKASSGEINFSGMSFTLTSFIVEVIAKRTTIDFSTDSLFAIDSTSLASSEGKRMEYRESFFIFFVINQKNMTLLFGHFGFHGLLTKFII